MISSRLTMLPLAFAATLVLAACGNSADDAASDVSAAADSAAADAAAMMDMEAAETFMVTLSGAAERPEPVATTAAAEATTMVYADSIVYVVNGLDVKGVTAVHIHRGGAEEAGPVLATLYTSDGGTDFANGPIASGTITRETTLAEGATFDEVRELVRTGAAYLNVHTVANPKGELRAQTVSGAM